MAKIIRPLGESYTDQIADGPRDLGRGLQPSRGKNAVAPNCLPSHIGSQHRALLRQVIAMLDKTAKKAGSLRWFHQDAYRERVLLAKELRKRLYQKYDELGIAPDSEAKDELLRIWEAKAHPYAKALGKDKNDTINESNPLNDANAQAIADERQALAAKRETDPSLPEPKSAEDFHGVWRARFLGDPEAPPNYPEMADRIFAHLFEQEVVLRPNRVRKETKQNGSHEATQRGLIENRARSIQGSAQNPFNEPTKFKYKDWDDETLCLYFKDRASGTGDVAKKIQQKLAETDDLKEALYGSFFGSALHKHFGHVLDEKPEGAVRQKAWNLHNAIRQLYQKISKNEGYRRAVKSAIETGGDRSEIAQRLPADQKKLLDRLTGTQKNADMSRYIRLGKLIVHASEAMLESAPDEETRKSNYHSRLAFLATSIGQSEIKQVETFTRVWRGSIALATRTTKSLADPRAKFLVKENDNRDIATYDVMKLVYDAWEDAGNSGISHELYRAQLPIIFGQKKITANRDESRQSIFLGANESEAREQLWGLMTLNASMRNSAHHFNVRRSFLKLLEDGIVKLAEPNEKTDNRGSAKALQISMDAFERLLEFDQNLQSEAIKLALQQVKAHHFVSEDSFKSILPELAKFYDGSDMMLPRFKATIGHVGNLNNNESVPLHSDLEGLANCLPPKDDHEGSDAARCRNGLLRELYNTGFRSWISERIVAEDKGKEVCDWAVSRVAESKHARTADFDKRRKRKFPAPVSIIEDIGLNHFTGLNDLFDQLAKLSMREQDQDIEYRADKAVQKKVSNRIEVFRQEIFAHLFARYMKKLKLEWLCSIDEALPQETDLDIAMSELDIEHHPFNEKWHSQFYTWLYFVPPPEAARLQHQMRKSAIMDQRWNADLQLNAGEGPTTDADAQSKLADVDRLMSLYLRVQAAGFDGNEHGERTHELKQLYKNSDDMMGVFVDEPVAGDGFEIDTRLTALRGARRGLRQLLRYSYLPVLSGIFKNHKVSRIEVDAFKALYSPEDRDESIADLVRNREETRQGILEAIKAKPNKYKNENARKKGEQSKKEELGRLCRDYKDNAKNAKKYELLAASAHLQDHIKAHHLMMRVVGRLTDYSLMWERDRMFAFLGMLELQEKGKGYELSLDGNDRLGIKLNDELRETLRENFDSPTQDDKPKKGELDVDQGFIVFLDPKRGFSQGNYDLLSCLLKRAYQETFRHAFVNVEKRNSKDTHPKVKQAFDDHGGKKQQVRNDLAHQNLLDLAYLAHYKKPNLTYAMNAVRGLMSYDRKMKNAVTKSIKRIFAEEGLFIRWEMINGRLKKPVIYPMVETHLTMVREHEDLGCKPGFLLPRASVRFVSLAKALFDFGSKGYFDEEEPDVLKYPSEFLTECQDLPEGFTNDVSVNFTTEIV